MESMYDPHGASAAGHRGGAHTAASVAAAAHLNHGAAAAAAAAAAMHHSAAAAAAAAGHSPYHGLTNAHVSQVGTNHMAASQAATTSVPDVHKRDKDAIYGYVDTVATEIFHVFNRRFRRVLLVNKI